jgi:hypothetical protein
MMLVNFDGNDVRDQRSLSGSKERRKQVLP